MKLALLLLSAANLVGAELPAKFVRAIHLTETSGRLGAIIGDNGRALGPLQIHKGCWRDSGVAGDYSQCTDLAYSKRVMTAYLSRYCPQAIAAKDFETLARLWNSGPNWKNKKKSTEIYWTKVKNNLK